MSAITSADLERAEEVWSRVMNRPYSSREPFPTVEGLVAEIKRAYGEAIAQERERVREAICKMIESYGEEPLHPRGLAAKIRSEKP